ncbi:MAG: hypothetical protein GY892_17695, partial [Shimia sp.]|nr:hypothetical protein [Shimia sp.]
KAACEPHGLSYLKGPEEEGFLRDVVHPTPAGVVAYAEALLQLIEMPHSVPSAVAKVKDGEFGSHRIGQSTSQSQREFSRGGYAVHAPVLNAGDKVTISFGKPTRVCGMSYLMGPRSGPIKLTYNGTEERIVACYDQFCYYERFGAIMFDPVVVQTIDIEQLSDLPEIPLLKEEADLSERVGCPVHLFTIANT